MTHYRTSYGDVMSKLIDQHGKGKSQEFFINNGDDSDYVLECQINEMKNSELIDLMESAGIIKVGSEDE